MWPSEISTNASWTHLPRPESRAEDGDDLGFDLEARLQLLAVVFVGRLLGLRRLGRPETLGVSGHFVSVSSKFAAGRTNTDTHS